MTFVQVYDGHGNPPKSVSHVHLYLLDKQIKRGLPNDTQEQQANGLRRVTTLELAWLPDEQVADIIYHLDTKVAIFSILDGQFLHTFFNARMTSCMEMGSDIHSIALSYDAYDFQRRSSFPKGHRFT